MFATLTVSSASLRTNQSNCPQCGHGASPGGVDGSIFSALPQTGQWFGAPSGVRDEIVWRMAERADEENLKTRCVDSMIMDPCGLGSIESTSAFVWFRAMRYLDLTLPTLEENLALDEVLLDEAEHGGPEHETLRFWEWAAYAVVLGSACRVRDDVLVEACRRDGVPLVRRTTGGGTVLVGRGCLNLAIVLRYARCAALRTVHGAFEYVMQRIVPVVQELGGDRTVHSAGLADLCVGDRKCGGSAQRRRRHALLYHGSVLYDFDLQRISRYLAEPARQPEYRRQRGHEEFLVNCGVDATTLKERLARVWKASHVPLDWPAERVARVVAEKFADRAWTFRR